MLTFALSILGPLFKLWDRILDIDPLRHVPAVTAPDPSWSGLVWLPAIAALFTVVGFAGFRRRDVNRPLPRATAWRGVRAERSVKPRRELDRLLARSCPGPLSRGRARPEEIRFGGCDMRLENKVALITGGYGGMGRASARLFAREGASVVVAGRNHERGQALVAEINDSGGTACLAELDTTSQQHWDAAVEQVRQTYGALHVLMNIVGSNAAVMFPNVDVDAWDKVFEINVTGTVRGIQACAPLMRDSGGGSIVNIGSVGGITGNFSTAYSSSKWALEGVSRSAAYVYADWGIRSNVIQPGWIETDMTAAMQANPALKKMNDEAMNTTVLLRRSGKAEEIAYTALFLACDESSYITGTDIVVDGGWFSAAPYLANERTHHLLDMLRSKSEAGPEGPSPRS
ncbi:SDR family oxidoreductase [Thermopolyspora sp. NPDC052614]|uniref:SDR family NAD(P)-dependent oxidoreductase n=1 Tax=Thermopolyspora sp. NPDC052614 TaxID=3155682 RepID=UPI00342521AA